MFDTYYVNARTALKEGLKIIGCNVGDEILAPNYICDTIISSIEEIGIKIVYFVLNDKLTPNWDHLDKLITKNTKGILMVNFFGNIIELNNYKKFSKNHSIFLIEDNAHGFGGYYKGTKVGSFGDIAISSPRKLANLNCGGVLHINNKNIVFGKKSKELRGLYQKNNSYRENYFAKLKSLIPSNIKTNIKKIYTNRPKYEDQNFFRVSEIFPIHISYNDIKKIKGLNWNLIRDSRNKKYKQFESLSNKFKLKKVFENFDDDLMPWCFPTYASNNKEAIEFFDWGWKNNIKVFSWPTFPESLVDVNTKHYKRWERLICFSTE